MRRGRGQGLRKQPVWRVVVEGKTYCSGLTRDRARFVALEQRRAGRDAHAVEAAPPTIQVDEPQLQEQLGVLLGC